MLDCIIVCDFSLDWNKYVLHKMLLLVIDVVALVRNVLDLTEPLQAGCANLFCSYYVGSLVDQVGA